MDAKLEPEIHLEVQRYYGETLETSSDLKTNACCTESELPEHVKAALAEVHDEVKARYYGCGFVIPEALAGARVLDLGCGAGQDCYLLSKMVGPRGRIVGVDMTPEQLAVARRHREYHADKFGHDTSNVEFIKGNIEHLENLGLDDASFDLIVSNCVVNLATDKEAVLENAYRLLRPGGEFHFADIYADRRVPSVLKPGSRAIRRMPGRGHVLERFSEYGKISRLCRSAAGRRPSGHSHGPGPGGTARWLGVLLCDLSPVSGWLVSNPLAKNYGQTIEYRGTVDYCPERLVLDKHHVFEIGKQVRVWRQYLQDVGGKPVLRAFPLFR